MKTISVYAAVLSFLVWVLSVVAVVPAGTAAAQSDNQQPVFNPSGYTFDMLPGTDGSGAAHSLGGTAATDADPGDVLAYSLRPSDPADRAYMVGDGNDALYRVDSDDFTAERVDGALSAFGVGETEPTGVVWHNGRLYMVGTATDALYVLDPDTGRAERVNQGVAQFGVSENNPRDLASHDGGLYMLGDTTDALYELNPETGLAERVGYSNQFGQDRNDPAALASFGSPAVLYALFRGTATVYRLDAATGAATIAASVSVPDGSSPQAMGVHGGKLYAVGSTPARVWELVVSDSAITAVDVPISADFDIGESMPSGIASGYTLPPGYTIGSSTGALAYTGGPAPHGVHTLYALVRDGRADDGTADTDWDDTAEVTVSVVNRAPSFDSTGYSYTLASGSDGSVTPVVLGTPEASDPEGQTLVYSLRGSDPADRMYMVGTAGQALYALDSDTSEAVRVGAAVQFGVSEGVPGGLAWHNGQLYMVGGGSNSLYTLDTSTGEAALVATGAQITGSGGAQITGSGRAGLTGSGGAGLTGNGGTGSGVSLGGVASHNGGLYVTTIGTGRLYRVDLDTLTGTRIGDDDFGDIGETRPYGIASHGSPAELYMIGDSTDRLYTLDVTTGTGATAGTTDGAATGTGAATRVGAATGFNAGEYQPVGLASHGGRLYMTGSTKDRLYTLDVTTGAAVRVGAATGFGVGESAAVGIASGYTAPADFEIGAATGEISYTGASAPLGVHTLYAQVSDGRTADGTADDTASAAADDIARVTVTVPNREPVFAQDPYEFYILPGVNGSVAPVAVGTAAASDPENQPLAYSLRTSDPANRMYMVSPDTDALYTLDSATGTAERVGTATQFGVGETIPSALAWHDGRLYMTGSGNDSLYTLDSTTGEATLVVTRRQLNSQSFEISGVASHKGELYLTSIIIGHLYRVDLDTLTSTLIAEHSFGSVNEQYPYDIASHGSPAELYMIGGIHRRLFTVDTDTGAATPVGDAVGFGIGENYPGRITSHNGRLYMTGGASKNRLYTLDTSTGIATAVGDAVDYGVGVSSARGIATGYSAPAGFEIGAATGEISYTGASAAYGTHYLQARVSDGRTDDNTASAAVDDSAVVEVHAVNRAPSFSDDGYSYTLASGSDGSTTPAAVGTPPASDPDGQPLVYSLRGSDPADSMYTTGGIAHALYTLDSATGTAERVGTAERFGVSETHSSGMAWHNGQLYMIGQVTDSLYTLDIVTGEATLVATERQIVGSQEHDIGGLASHESDLYVTTTGTGRLYRFDLDALVGTQVGADGFGPAGEDLPRDIASHGSPAELYMIGGTHKKLYEIDTTTGTATPVGDADGYGLSDVGNADGLGIGDPRPEGLTSHNGQLYMTEGAGDRLYRLDDETGIATAVGDAVGYGVGESNAAGIATGYRAPAGFGIGAAGEISYTGAPAAPGGTHCTLGCPTAGLRTTPRTLLRTM